MSRGLPELARQGAGVVVVTAMAVALLGPGSVALRDVAGWTLAVGGSVVLPGVALWRWRLPGAGVGESVALGSPLGALAATTCYLLGRALGTPWGGAVPGVLALGLLLVTRRRRRPTVRGEGRARHTGGDGGGPGWFGWAVAGLALWPVLWLALVRFPGLAVTEASLVAPGGDEHYHLSLLTEFRHHAPGEVPFVAGTPLRYHWLLYPWWASLSWLGGAEAVTVLRLLGPLTVLVGTVVALAWGARRVSGSSRAALLGTLVVAWGFVPDVWWPPNRSLVGPLLSFPYAVNAPAVVFALWLSMPVVVGFSGVLRRGWGRGRRGLGDLLGLGALLLAIGAAKSTMLPLLGAGLLGVVVLCPGFRRRAGELLGLVAVAFLVDLVVVYGGSTRSLTWGPLSLLEALVTRSGRPVDVPLSAAGEVGVAGVVVVGVGVVLLPALCASARQWRRRDVLDPLVVLSGSACVAGVGVALLTTHPGLSQLHFVWAGTGLAALGLARAWRLLAPRDPRRGGPLRAALAAALVLPLVAPAWEAISLVGIPPDSAGRGGGATSGGGVAAYRLVPEGGVGAARWLRAHSDEGDLVATNGHCATLDVPGCSRNAFWVAGLSERRVLVEGWAFVPPETVGADPLLAGDVYHPEFWDPERLRANDAAFDPATAADLAVLRDRWSVRWLLVDTRAPSDVAALDRGASRVYAAGDVLVYRLP